MLNPWVQGPTNCEELLFSFSATGPVFPVLPAVPPLRPLNPRTTRGARKGTFAVDWPIHTAQKEGGHDFSTVLSSTGRSRASELTKLPPRSKWDINTFGGSSRVNETQRHAFEQNFTLRSLETWCLCNMVFALTSVNDLQETLLP